ncbi:MAG: TonB-dependent receptor [Gammaproteobacteria bacterium]|nr:TonB-dependent receptor [Gammaproteobacteria bacterium]
MKRFFYKKKYKLVYFIFGSILCLSEPASFATNAVIIPDVKFKSKNAVHQKPSAYASSSQFTKAEITKSPVINLSQFLKQQQSVVRLTNSSGDASQTALSLRGFGDNAAANTLILIDGFPLTNPSLLAPNFNSIPLSDIEHIEILQGSEGSLWGDQAVGGVVNIITKHPKKFFLNSIISVGNYNSYYDNILIGDKAKNGLFYKVFGLIGKTDNYRDHNQQKANNLAAQIGIDYARGTVSLNAQSYGDIVYFPGGLSEEQFNHNPRQATEYKNYSRYRTNIFQLLSRHELSDQWVIETRLNYHSTDGNGFVYLNFNRNDSLASINPRVIGNINNNKLIFGYDGQVSRYQLINSKVQSKTSATQNDFYFQTTIPLAQKIDFILGAREAWQTNRIEAVVGQSTNALNRVFVTEQGVDFHPTEALSFFLRRDGNFSFPKANEETWLPESVQSLKIQTGTSYEVGGEWQTEKYKSQLSIYRLELHNEIAFNPSQTAEQPFGAFNNLDETLRYGISLSQDYQVTSCMKVNGQINYVHARFSSGPFAGNFIPAVPAINANAGLSYRWTERWLTQYTLLYTGARYASEDVQNAGKRVSGYWLNDIALQYFIKSFIFSFEVHNLLNKQYANYVFYDAYTQQNSYYPAAGRNFLLTLKINVG